MTTIYLQPRIIPLSQLRTEAQGERSGIQSDLPQAVTIKRADNFANRGFIDAADYLSTDQSIQVEEQISGKKSISIRGSQTSVTGSGGFAGVVNIVPKIERDYLVKFQQRVGTYNSGTWGLSLYKNFNDLHSAYSYRKGCSTRQFSGPDFGQQHYLINKAEHHTANLDYRFANNLLSASHLRSHLDYDNQRYRENINNLDQLVSLRYRGKIFRFSGFDLAASQHQLQEDQHLNSGSRFFAEVLDKHLANTSYHCTVNKKWLFSSTEFFLSYQFENVSLNFRDQLTNPEMNRTDLYNEKMRRRQHGFVAIAKLFNQLESRYLPVFDMDICMRNDHLTDARETDQFSTDKTWNKTTLKFSSNMEGQSQNVVYHGYFNYGKNVKFPTMLQQVSSTQRSFSNDTIQLKPEISNGYDLGFEMSGETPEAIVSAIEGWQVSFYLFRNFFTDKLRTSYTPGFPLAYYDNVQTAQISGFETRAGLFLLNKKLTLEIGYSNYAISDKAAFPFKYDNKFTVDTKINHHGYNFHLHAFYEGEQTGWIRDFAGGFDEVTLPAHFNLDLHLKINIEIKKFKVLANISVRNLLNENIELVGLAVRDRRYYLTVGVAY